MANVRVGYTRKVPRAQYSTEGFTLEVELAAEETTSDWQKAAEKLAGEVRDRVNRWLDGQQAAPADGDRADLPAAEKAAGKKTASKRVGKKAAEAEKPTETAQPEEAPHERNGKPPTKRAARLLETLDACKDTEEFEEVCGVIRQQASKLDSEEMAYLREAASRRRAELMQT